MDRGSWWATVHRVTEELDMTGATEHTHSRSNAEEIRGRKAQNRHPTPSEVHLFLALQSSLRESAGLDHQRSDRSREMGWGLQQPTLISWPTIFLPEAAMKQRSQPQALPICRTESIAASG